MKIAFRNEIAFLGHGTLIGKSLNCKIEVMEEAAEYIPQKICSPKS